MRLASGFGPLLFSHVLNARTTTFILCDLSSHVRFDDAAYTIFSLRLFASVWLCEDVQELKAAGDDYAVATRERRAAVGRTVAPHCSVARSGHLWTMVLKRAQCALVLSPLRFFMRLKLSCNQNRLSNAQCPFTPSLTAGILRSISLLLHRNQLCFFFCARSQMKALVSSCCRNLPGAKGA